MTLAAETVTVVRRGGRVVLEAVDCAFAPGRITGIVGPNGAGKSTLLKTLARILPLSRGRVVLDGRDIASFDRLALSSAIAYLPQERSVHWPLAVRDIVGLGRIPHHTGPRAPSRKDREAIDAAIATMDLRHLADRRSDQISGGELARALIARALAQEARVILADEPMAGLDPAHALELFRVLRELATQQRTVAVALHDLTSAARFCDDIVMLCEGRVASRGPTAEVLDAAHLAPVFGVDFVVGKLDGLPVVLASS
jgi:iron complex transport system ATP-binding protein